jgi:hypothetical protein
MHGGGVAERERDAILILPVRNPRRVRVLYCNSCSPARCHRSSQRVHGAGQRCWSGAGAVLEPPERFCYRSSTAPRYTVLGTIRSTVIWRCTRKATASAVSLLGSARVPRAKSLYEYLSRPDNAGTLQDLSRFEGRVSITWPRPQNKAKPLYEGLAPVFRRCGAGPFSHAVHREPEPGARKLLPSAASHWIAG